MNVYFAFGRIVVCDRPIPFEPAPDAGERPLRLVEAPGLADEIDRAGLLKFHDVDDFDGRSSLRAYRTDDVVVFEHADYVLRFQLDEDLIEYELGERRQDDFAFGLMVERVAVPLFELLARPQIVGLHGGAVALDGSAWVFVGRSGAGKSTTARELIGRGARLLSDDLTLVDVDAGRVLAGCPAVRLRQEAGSVAEAVRDAPLAEGWSKRWFRLDARHAATEAAPLAGVVALEPLDADAGQPRFEVERLRGQEAFVAIMQQVFNFSEPAPEFATRLFQGVKRLLGDHRVLRYRYRRSADGQPTHVEPLLDVMRGHFP